MNITLLILVIAAIVLGSIRKVNDAASQSSNADVILNAVTLRYVAGIAIAILLALALLSIGG